MLSELQVRDYAIVDRLYLKFQPGMTVFSGETGAGKSIAIDALGIALGDRADTSVVRNGAKRAEITASFDISDNPAATAWLVENELDEDGECILRRTVNKDSGSKAYINGRPIPLQRVRELAECLIDIHSQHQHQSLLRSNDQRRLLDDYGQANNLAKSVTKAYRQWHSAKKRFDEIQSSEQDRQSRVDFLKFQLDEFEKLNPQQGEWQELEREHKTLANIEKIQNSIAEAVATLVNEDSGTLTQINHAISVLEKAVDYDPHLASRVELLTSAQVQIEEVINDLHNDLDNSDLDQNRFQSLDQRIGEFMELARKHRCKPEELTTLQSELQNELDQLSDAENSLEHLEEQIRVLLGEYQSFAATLSKKRQTAAKKLATEVTKLLKDLGMGGAKFNIELTPVEENLPTQYGSEQINFVVSTNAGQASQALGKIVSGGELSRISLAIQVITAKVAQIPCMVFDEVDVGIGGGIAEIVGQLLRKLGENRQVLCITHQPQVASQGHQHYLVEKKSTKTSTSTSFTLLDELQRREEIARMLGGVNLTETTLQHAQEMLETVEQ